MSTASEPRTAHGVDSARRRFLRGRFGSAARAPIRPPWALPESAFLAACTRCDACARACPSGIISRGDGGYPEVSFRSGECTFCAECATACKPHALATGRIAWRLQPVLATNCLARGSVLCRSCADACEEGAIRIAPGRSAPRVQVAAAACTGCGACVLACTVSAVHLQATAAP